MLNNDAALEVLRRHQESFMLQVNIQPDGCWQWQGTILSNGYGYAYGYGSPSSMRRAHRVAYELFVGPIPEGKVLDHLCRNRACVNPSHLEPVTVRENVLRGEGITAKNAAKTHCPKGHPLEGYNVLPNKYGKRKCRICTVESTRLWREKNGLTSTHPRQKLSAEAVDKILQRAQSGERVADLAQEFSVTESHIYRMIKGGRRSK